MLWDPKMKKVENEGQNNILVYLKKDNCRQLKQAKLELNQNKNENKIKHNCYTMYR